ncbi:hypothetical protein, partial [Streptococcus sp. DD10]|uniref:hypothetical protein n=1 Tax=Streptococcus sp. DD10 TaxID=1777878 RepID=UPI000A822E6A
ENRENYDSLASREADFRLLLFYVKSYQNLILKLTKFRKTKDRKFYNEVSHLALLKIRWFN